MLKVLKKYLGKKRRDFKLIKYHFKLSDKAHKPLKKRIIVCFNGKVPHGGLVDRLKGIISFYDIAKQLDYDFYIQFNHPFTLETFLEPNDIDWRINENETSYSFGNTKLINVINNFDINPLELIKSSSQNTFLVYSNIDYLSENNPNKGENAIEALWRSHFNTLFKKADYLKQALQNIELNPYISLHTRFTSIMGDFIDSTSKVISIVERKELLSTLEIEVNKITDSNTVKCYVFSDSSLFLNEISKRCNVTVLKGTPFHMDSYQGNADLESHLKTLVDFFMISESEHVFFLKAGQMYHSAFSKYASIIGDKPFTKIEL